MDEDDAMDMRKRVAEEEFENYFNHLNEDYE